MRRFRGGHLRGGHLEVAVVDEGVALLGGEQLAGQPGGVDHAVHAGGACSPTLAGCTQACPQTGMPARCAAAVSRRTDTLSSWA